MDFKYNDLINALSALPSCIFFKDLDLNYVFSTNKWGQIKDGNINGKKDIEIRKDIENADIAYETDKKILETKKGANYTIKAGTDDDTQYMEIIKEPVFDDKGNIIGIIGLVNDITKIITLNNKLKEMSTIDSLTKLYNRQAGLEAIQSNLAKSKKSKLFCLLDIDKFKLFNDNYGHMVGDTVLQKVGKALKDSISEDDIAMRIGGDEFIILLNNINTNADITIFIEKLFNNINSIYIPDILDSKITISIGLTSVKEYSTVDNLYATVDSNMYKAKKINKNSYIYTS